MFVSIMLCVRTQGPYCVDGKPVKSIVLFVKESLIGTDVHRDLKLVLERNFKLVDAGDADPDTIAISVGGDGTFLLAARVVPSTMPILGINMGRRGAVTDALPDDIPVLVERLRSGSFCIEKRVKLEVAGDGRSASVVNEVYIARRYEGQTPTYKVVLGGDELYSRRMDGLIVSTPTGSTGYNLSAGGPVLYELMRSAIITPVLPLTRVPPVVVPLNEKDRITIMSTHPMLVLLDGQLKIDVEGPGSSVVIGPSKDPLNVVRINRMSFQHLRKTLR